MDIMLGLGHEGAKSGELPPFSAAERSRRLLAFRRLSDEDLAAMERLDAFGPPAGFHFGAAVAHLLKEGASVDELKKAVDGLATWGELEKDVEREEEKA